VVLGVGVWVWVCVCVCAVLSRKNEFAGSARKYNLKRPTNPLNKTSETNQ